MELFERARSPRRSKLVVKGGTRDIISESHASDADVLQLELESGFDEAHRKDAVEATYQALCELDWSTKEAWVRFRQLDNPETLDELELILKGQPQLVYCAKVRSATDVRNLDDAVTTLEKKLGLPVGRTQIGAVIERVEALASVEEIAAASPRMGALMFGANDMSLDFGYRRTGIPASAEETIYIRSRMILAARLARIDVFDAAHMDRGDLAGSEVDAEFSARMGFTGKTALSPAQVPGIHRAFIPTQKEVQWSRAILDAGSRADENRRFFDGERVTLDDLSRANSILNRLK